MGLVYQGLTEYLKSALHEISVPDFFRKSVSPMGPRILNAQQNPEVENLVSDSL